jgi:hypothetical protein
MVVIRFKQEANVDRVQHIVEADPTLDSYDNLKGGLVASHVMSDYQKIDQLLQQLEAIRHASRDGEVEAGRPGPVLRLYVPTPPSL